MKVKLAFFDCDGTLIFGNPWLHLHYAMGIKPEVDKKWVNQFLAKEITNEQWIKNIEEYYIKNGLNRKKFEDILNLANYKFNKEANNLMDFLREEKIQTAIVSSGIDYYVSKVADYFGIKYSGNNAKFIFDKNGNFKNIEHGLDDLEQKVADINNICREIGVSPQESIFVGDGANDVKAFEYTKRGIMYIAKYPTNFEDIWTSANTALLRAAWKKVDNLEKIIDIIKKENGSK